MATYRTSKPLVGAKRFAYDRIPPKSIRDREKEMETDSGVSEEASRRALDSFIAERRARIRNRKINLYA